MVREGKKVREELKDKEIQKSFPDDITGPATILKVLIKVYQRGSRKGRENSSHGGGQSAPLNTLFKPL